MPIRLDQLGNVLDSVEDDKQIAWYNNSRSMVLAISRQPGTNTVEVVENVRKVIPELQASLPPAIKMEIMFDASESIRNSIRDVEFTLLVTIALVVMVIFLFLRSDRDASFRVGSGPVDCRYAFAAMYSCCG